MGRPERSSSSRAGRTVAALVLGLATSLPAWTNTYRWVDERGRVHYSDRPPLQAAEPDVLDRQGRVRRKAQPQAAPSSADAGRRDTLRERQDRALLSTYVDENEIDLARERALAQEKARQDSPQALLAQANARLARINAEWASLEKAGRVAPESLRQSRGEAQREIARLTDMLAHSAAAMAQIEARYEAYKLRFRELKGLRAETSSNNRSAPTSGDVKP